MSGYRCILLATDGLSNATRAADSEPPGFSWEAQPDEHPVPAGVAANWGHPHAERIRLGGVEVDGVVLERHATDAIVVGATALAVNLVAIGRQGRTDGMTGNPGSVAEELTRRCPCAPAIVP